MAFQFDTSGKIILNQTRIIWSDLSPFEQGYVERAFAELDKARLQHYHAAPWGSKGREVPICAAFSDLAPKTLARIIEDCSALHFEIIGCVIGGDVARGSVAWDWRQRAQADPRNPAGEIHARFPPLTVILGHDGKVRFAEDRALTPPTGDKR